MSKSKRHHYVPQGYLARFGRDELVRVKRRQPPRTHPVGIKNVAAETGFYTVTDDDGAPSTVIEEALSELEGHGLMALRRIDNAGLPPAAGTDDRELLSLYLAVQMTRTPRRRSMLLFPGSVTAYADGRDVDKALIADFLADEHLGYRPKAVEVEAAWTFYHGSRALTGGDSSHDDAVVIPLKSVEVCIPHFRNRHWRLETSRKPNFLTSDAPLVLWRPDTEADAYRGFGLVDAQEIRFPVSPTAQLVLTRGEGTSADAVKLGRVASCNQDLADTCERIVIGHPDRPTALDKIELSRQGPTLRFNIGPGTREYSDGTQEPMGDVLHTWMTRR